MILRAYHEAIKSRIHTSEWCFFKRNEEENLLRMLSQLQNRTYCHEWYKRIVIKDSKKRYISSPTLQDHILHHMLYQELYPVLDKRMCHNTFATRRGKWLHVWLDYFCKQLYKYRNRKDIAYMKVDVSKYFYSVGHERLKEKLYRFIHNPDIQYAISLAIDSYRTSSIFDHLFSKDSAYRKTKAKWLPIGAIYSQIFANFYLYDVDWYINQHIKPFVYMRYMDDMVFVDTRDNLIKMRWIIIELIENQWLVLVPKKISINTFSHGLTLLGWRIWIKAGKVIRTVGKNNKKKLWKSIDAYNNLTMDTYTSVDIAKIISSIEARKSHFHHTKNPQNYLRGYNAHISSILSLSVGK